MIAVILRGMWQNEDVLFSSDETKPAINRNFSMTCNDSADRIAIVKQCKLQGSIAISRRDRHRQKPLKTKSIITEYQSKITA